MRIHITIELENRQQEQSGWMKKCLTDSAWGTEQGCRGVMEDRARSAEPARPCDWALMFNPRKGRIWRGMDRIESRIPDKSLSPQVERARSGPRVEPVHRLRPARDLARDLAWTSIAVLHCFVYLAGFTSEHSIFLIIFLENNTLIWMQIFSYNSFELFMIIS